jgi:hypothetical protein
MWLFLSRRIRTWAVLGIGIPAARFGLRKLSARAAARNSNSRAASALNRADSALAFAGGRRARRS